MKQKLKDGLTQFRHNFFREKYRFDQGNAFLVFVNFALLVATLVNQSNGNSDHIKYYVLAGLFGTWFLGYILDKVVRVQDIQERVILKRSPIWKENFDRHDGHNEKLENLINRLEKIEKKLEKKLEEKAE
jgi:hypothetical protein